MARNRIAGHEIGEESSSFMLGDLDTRAQVIQSTARGFDSFAFNGAL